MGRPKKSEPRYRQLNLSLTDSELASIQRRAEAIGMRPVHFGRTLLLDTDRKLAPRPNVESHVDRLVYLQLIRIGNNLNQLVRHLHRTGEPIPVDLELLLADIRHLISRMPK